MAKDAGKALRSVGGKERPSAPRSVVGDSIADHLRALQAQRGSALEVDQVVAGLVDAIVALAERGLLVSVSVTRDQRSVRLSTLIGKEWMEWFTSDPEHAAELAAQVVRALED